MDQFLKQKVVYKIDKLVQICTQKWQKMPDFGLKMGKNGCFWALVQFCTQKWARRPLFLLTFYKIKIFIY